MEIKARVTKTSSKEDRYGIECGKSNWYNGFGDLPCKEGDFVRIEYIETPDKKDKKRIWKNVQEVEVLEEPQVEKVMSDAVAAIHKDSSNKQGSMFASYAKDIFIAIHKDFVDTNANKVMDHKMVMDKAIELTKQAKEAFE